MLFFVAVVESFNTHHPVQYNSDYFVYFQKNYFFS